MPLIPPHLSLLLEALGEPKSVFEYFLAYTQVPHGSNNGTETDNLKQIVALLVEWAKELGLEYKVDEAENIVIRKPATPGFEDKPSICLQAHMDMVCQATADEKIDFKKDPLKPRIVDEWLMATNTSLGADDGIGVAAGFAILADKELKHGPLELLITRDEEVGLLGAAALGEGMLNSKLMINVDSEEEDAICFGCAGGFTFTSELPCENDLSFAGKPVIVGIGGCHGGHTGVDCSVGYANPLKLLARILKATESCGYRLCSVTGGTAHNAIPRDANFEVVVPEDKYDEFKALVHKHYDEIAEEFKYTEKTMKLMMAEHPTVYQATPAETTRKVVNFLNLIHDGVMRMSTAVPGLVETSFMGTVVKRDARGFNILGAGRSSSGSQLEMVYQYITTLCDACGWSKPPKISPYPGWQPNPESPLIKTMVDTHEEILGHKPNVYAIHAGLECGLVQDKYPGVDCASIGPTLQNPHSPGERLLIASVDRFYRFLVGVIRKLAL